MQMEKLANMYTWLQAKLCVI